jgi:hypothetical protein
VFGISIHVAIEVTHSLWPSNTPRNTICSVILSEYS